MASCGNAHDVGEIPLERHRAVAWITIVTAAEREALDVCLKANAKQQRQMSNMEGNGVRAARTCASVRPCVRTS